MALGKSQLRQKATCVAATTVAAVPIHVRQRYAPSAETLLSHLGQPPLHPPRLPAMTYRTTFQERPTLYRVALSPVNRSMFLAHLQPEGFGNKALKSHEALAADPSGAVIYVIAVVSFWSLSIFLLIVSYIRKNRVDRNVSLYLKQIQMVRSRSDREKVINYVNSLWKEDALQQQQQQQHRPNSSLFLSPLHPRSRTLRQSHPLPNRPRRLHKKAIPSIFVEDSGAETANSDNVSTASDVSAKDETLIC